MAENTTLCHFMESSTSLTSLSCTEPTMSSANSLPLRGNMTVPWQKGHALRNNIFEFRHGRRYLRDVPYPLPCDLAEMQRQNLRTLLSITVLGRPICAPRWEIETPKYVLELCCGTGCWSAMAHDYFAKRGTVDVEYTGLDIAPLAPDYRRQGINWKFVQHDIRRTPLPFEDDKFDIVMIKDTSLTNPIGRQSQRLLDDCIRIIRPGGTLEVWDSDYLIRALPADSPPPPVTESYEQDIAEETATFAIAPGYPFAAARNKFIQKANSWVTKALDKYDFIPTPCMHYASMLLQEEELTNFSQRRVAIPLGELRWEKNRPRHQRVSNGHDSPMSVDSGTKFDLTEKATLTPDQAALRYTALMTVVQQLESMEIMLKEVSGKNTEDWNTWWTSMMSEMLDPTKAASTGECLEIGAWWATKLSEEDD